MVVQFKVEPTFATTPTACKNDTLYKYGQN